MTVDPAALPGLLLIFAEFVALAAVGYVVARVVLRQADERMALAQGLVVGLALWGLVVNFVLHLVPGLAGAIVGWVVMLALGAVLTWRAPYPIGPRPRVAAGFVVAVLALFGVALASRQLISFPDTSINLGLAAFIRAGGFPPELPWNAGTLIRYHHGTPLLVGLLAPPTGRPDLPFAFELLGAYAWTAYVLVVATALLQRASVFSVLVTAPLMLSSGLWTFSSVVGEVLLLPLPAGLPEAGLRASLTDVYWPHVDVSAGATLSQVLPDIWKPGFPLGHALAFVVLSFAERHERWSWGETLTLAGLVGFLGVLSTTLVPVVVIAWGGLAVMHFLRARRTEPPAPAALRLGAGPILGGLLVLGGGGAFTGVLDGSPQLGLTLAQGIESVHWQALGSFDVRPGGLGRLGLGPVALGGAAVVLARRDRLVVTLAACAGLLVLLSLALTYQPAPWDTYRIAGHARNLSLVALVLAMSSRLSSLPVGRWRYAAAAVLVALITWPTVVTPARSLGLAIGNGLQLANARWVQTELRDEGVDVPMRRFQLRAVTGPVADYLRDHTAVDARVLATEWQYWNVFLGTGRPNNAGFANLVHQFYQIGPEYLDAVHYLEPAAIRRLGLEYVHATDAWAAGLPARAQEWLADPRLFELLVRDGAETVYRIRSAFLQLDVVPHPQSYEALRAVPPSTVVHLSSRADPMERLRVASVLSHARLLGTVDELRLHLRTPAPWTVDAPGEQAPDLVVLPPSIGQWTRMFPASSRQPVWQNGQVAIYAPNGGFASITPPGPALEAPPVTVRVTDARLEHGRLKFMATFTEHAPERWTGQDWVVIPVNDEPWAIPARFLDDRRGPEVARWFGGLISSGSATSSHTYRFDARAPELSVRNDAGAFVPLATSAAELAPGSYTLALRLRHEWQPNSWRQAALIPVIQFKVSEAAEVSYAVFGGVLGRVLP